MTVVEALYSDKDRLRKIRELLRIRGFGFDFETKFSLPEDAAEPGPEVEEYPEDAEEAIGEEEASAEA